MLLDLSLARRVEMAEAEASVDAAHALRKLRPESGAYVERISGGVAIFCGVNSPLTQVIGLGLDGPVSSEDLDRLEQCYFARGDGVRVELCPLAHSSVPAEFGKRNYRVIEFSNVMARAITKGDRWADPGSGVTTERLEPAHVELWTRTVAQGFAEQYPITPELLEVMQVFATTPRAECYLARVNGNVAGGGTLALRDGVAGLFGSSTLPEFRGRGVQTALLNTRLRRAGEAGCDLAMCIAQPGSTSARNVLRARFETLYTRVKFEKARPA